MKLKQRPEQTVNGWLASVPAGRRDAINAVRDTVNRNLPEGYEETVDWGVLSWVVPLSTLPDTYNGRPLMLAGLGAHRKVMTIYLMHVYGDAKTRKKFQDDYTKSGKKLDMGGSCVHFKTLDDLPLDVIAEAISSVSVDEYVKRYLNTRGKKSSAKKATKTAKKSAKKSAKSGRTKR